jgi:hypothetical protein
MGTHRIGQIRKMARGLALAGIPCQAVLGDKLLIGSEHGHDGSRWFASIAL